MVRSKAFLGIGALLAAIILAAFAGIAAAQAPTPQTPPTQTQPAQPTGPHIVRMVGNVASISGNSFTLTTKNFGQVTVNVSDSTWIVIRKNGTATQGSLSDIQTGTSVAVEGTTTDNKTVTARVINQPPALKPIGEGRGRMGNGGARFKLAGHFAGGTVKSVNGSVLTITDLRGQDVTVNTTGSTVVLNDGFQSVSSLKVGDQVTVVGKQEAQSNNGTTTPANQPRTITAWALRVDNPGTKLVSGSVDSVNGNTVTIKGIGHRLGIAVTLDGSTGYKSATLGTDNTVTISNASQSNLQSGSRVIVEGVTGPDGKSLVAKAVLILPAKAQTTPAAPTATP